MKADVSMPRDIIMLMAALDSNVYSLLSTLTSGGRLLGLKRINLTLIALAGYVSKGCWLWLEMGGERNQYFATRNISKLSVIGGALLTCSRQFEGLMMSDEGHIFSVL